jgi:hypothetical protein
MRRIATDVGNFVIARNHHDPTGVVAITGTGGADLLCDV